VEIALASAAFVVAAICAGLMGFAIQRGATCTVAAMDEIVARRRFNRLISMVEASVWVVGGLLIAQYVDVLPNMPNGYSVNGYTISGGILLGLGAYVNRACVFGAIARLGSGEWAYVATPIGFYLGCLTVGSVFAPAAPQKLGYGSPVLQGSLWIALLFAAFLLFRLARVLLAVSADPTRSTFGHRVRHLLTVRVWSPHAATAVIGVTFLVMLLLVGAWAYTDVLADFARGMAGSLVARTALLGMLFLGAVVGGETAGRFRSTRVAPVQLLKCFVGGMLMGWGSLLIPGGNDGLILVGMPLLWPYAWVAFLAMCVSIGAALCVEQARSTTEARQLHTN